MKYSEMQTGMFVIRTRELSWLRVLSGEICYVMRAGVDKIHVSITKDCVPKGDVYEVPSKADDGNWYDVSELVMDANACIVPSPNTCSFSTAVEATYRNYLELGDKVQPLSLDEAIGNICVLGEKSKNGSTTAFSKAGFYVISSDEKGYAIVYQGYCDYYEQDETRDISLRILNLTGTQRAFYPAKEIIPACHEAFLADVDAAQRFEAQYREKTIISAADSDLSAHHDGIASLVLES